MAENKTLNSNYSMINEDQSFEIIEKSNVLKSSFQSKYEYDKMLDNAHKSILSMSVEQVRRMFLDTLRENKFIKEGLKTSVKQNEEMISVIKQFKENDDKNESYRLSAKSKFEKLLKDKQEIENNYEQVKLELQERPSSGQIELLNKEIYQYTSKCNDLKIQVEQLEKQNIDLNNIIEKMKKELQEYSHMKPNDDKSNNSDEIILLSLQLSSCKQETHELEKQLGEKTSFCKKLESDVKWLTDNNLILKQQLDAMQKANHNEKIENLSLEEKLANNNKTLEKLTFERDSLKEALIHLERERDLVYSKFKETFEKYSKEKLISNVSFLKYTNEYSFPKNVSTSYEFCELQSTEKEEAFDDKLEIQDNINWDATTDLEKETIDISEQYSIPNQETYPNENVEILNKMKNLESELNQKLNVKSKRIDILESEAEKHIEELKSLRFNNKQFLELKSHANELQIQYNNVSEENRKLLLSCNDYKIKIDELNAKLINVSDLLNLEKEKSRKLLQKISGSEENEKIQILQSQVEIYKSDFLQERRQREELAMEKNKIQSELMALQIRFDEIRKYKITKPDVPIDENFFCPICNKAFNTIDLLQNHAPNCCDYQEEENSKNDYKLICPLCQMIMKDFGSLQEHCLNCDG